MNSKLKIEQFLIGIADNSTFKTHNSTFYIADVAATSHPYTQLHTPKRSTPAVQRARAVRVAPSLWNVAIGVSVLLMYMHFTIFK